MNIALFSPNRNPYSETFINAHKKYLEGSIFYYYGIKSGTKLENSQLISPWRKNFLLVNKKIFNRGQDFLWVQMLLNSLKANKIDVILIEYGNHAHRLLPVLSKIAIPVIVHFHGYDASVERIIKNCDQYGQVFSRATSVISVSRQMEQRLLDLGCPESKLIYNVYGPHPDFMNVEPTLGFKQLLFVGRFTDKKAPYYTILAFNKVLKTCPDAKLTMAGAGDLLETCKNLVRYLKIDQYVDFPGIICRDQFIQFLSQSRALVQHSVVTLTGDTEGTPLSVLEASAAGVPVIASKHAGINDVVIDEETGLLFDEHDVEAMAESMIKLLENQDYAMTLGKQSKLRIEKEFSLKKHIKHLNEVITNSVN